MSSYRDSDKDTMAIEIELEVEFTSGTRLLTSLILTLWLMCVALILYLALYVLDDVRLLLDRRNACANIYYNFTSALSY